MSTNSTKRNLRTFAIVWFGQTISMFGSGMTGFAFSIWVWNLTGHADVSCGKFGSPIYQQLRSHYANEQLRIWQVSHFGGHQFAPTLLDWPFGHCWGHLSSEVLEVLIKRNDDVLKLRPFYRGWNGINKFEQIAEREIWMQEGWQWLDYLKTGRVVKMDEVDENWAEVRIDFSNQARNIKGV